MHFLAFLMEKCTLTFGGKSIFTHEGRLTTLTVDTDHMTRVSINALRTVLDRLYHHSQYKLREKSEVIPKCLTFKNTADKENCIFVLFQ